MTVEALPKKKGLDPLRDPTWQTHQQRNLSNGDTLLIQTETDGLRCRFYLGQPLNAKEILWDWMIEIAAEEVAWLAADFSFTSVLLARKAQGAIAHLGGHLGVTAAKVTELQQFIADQVNQAAADASQPQDDETEQSGVDEPPTDAGGM